MCVLMKIRIQSIETKLFLTRNGEWRRGSGDAGVFVDVVEAITICLRRGIKNVRFTATNEQSGKESYAYPIGGDPVAHAQRKQLRRCIREQRRVKQEHRELVARMQRLAATPESG